MGIFSKDVEDGSDFKTLFDKMEKQQFEEFKNGYVKGLRYCAEKLFVENKEFSQDVKAVETLFRNLSASVSNVDSYPGETGRTLGIFIGLFKFQMEIFNSTERDADVIPKSIGVVLTGFSRIQGFDMSVIKKRIIKAKVTNLSALGIERFTEVLTQIEGCTTKR